jgi:hypothetical protein
MPDPVRSERAMREVIRDAAPPATIGPAGEAESIQIEMRFEFSLTCSDRAKSIEETGSSFSARIRETQATNSSGIAFTGDAPIERSAYPQSKVAKTSTNRMKAYEPNKLQALRLTGRDSIQDTGEGSWLGFKPKTSSDPLHP